MPISVRVPSISTPDTIIPLQFALVPASIDVLINQTLSWAEDGRSFTTRCTKGSKRCIRSSFSILPVWAKGYETEAACRVCTKKRNACLLLTEDKTLVLLPLAKELRDDATTVNDEGFWKLKEGVTVRNDIWV
jgi:hypothetical protein